MAESKGESKGTTKPPVFSFGYLHIDDRLLAGPNCLLWNLRYIFFHFRPTICSKANICVSFLCSLHFKGPGKDCFNKAILASQLTDLLQTFTVIQDTPILPLHSIRKQDGFTKPIGNRH